MSTFSCWSVDWGKNAEIFFFLNHILKKNWTYICQNGVDWLIHQIFLARQNFQTKCVSKRCWLAKNPYETSLQSIHMVQNVVDLLICQKISCKAQFSNYMCVKSLLICQKILARPPCSIYIWCKMLLICWFAKKILARPNFWTTCLSKHCWFAKKSLQDLLAVYPYGAKCCWSVDLPKNFL